MLAKNITYHALASGIERLDRDSGRELVEPYRTVASEVWVDNPKWLNTASGTAVGVVHDLWLSVAGALGLVGAMTATGKDHLPMKGVLYGVGFGALVTGILSLSGRKRLSDASPVGTLAYAAAHAVYGLTAATIARRLGDPSLFGRRRDRVGARPRPALSQAGGARRGTYGHAGSSAGERGSGGWHQD